MRSEGHITSVHRRGSACVVIAMCGAWNSSQHNVSDTSQLTPPARLLHLYRNSTVHSLTGPETIPISRLLST